MSEKKIYVDYIPDMAQTTEMTRDKIFSDMLDMAKPQKMSDRKNLIFCSAI